MSSSIWDFLQAQAWAQRQQALEQPSALPPRAELRRRYFQSLGLGEAPPPANLAVRWHRELPDDGCTITPLHYQLAPDCWCGAYLFRPATPAPARPGVLYLCGHALLGGFHYQHHARAWAQRGYTCLLAETIQQHDHRGDHHGVYLNRQPQLVSRGFSAAGAEVLNSIRALDVLIQHGQVDPGRIGVTGISGGGNMSFQLMLADERVAISAPVAGVTYVPFALRDGHLAQHCDCNYIPNRFGLSQIALGLLAAPRPLLLLYARHDGLYSLEEFRTLAADLGTLYAHAGAAGRVELFEYDGPHAYQPETIERLHAFFDQHLAGEPRPAVDTLALAQRPRTDAELSPTQGVMLAGNRLAHLQEVLTPEAQRRLPTDADDAQRQRAELALALQENVLRAAVASPDAQPTLVGDWQQGDLWRRRLWRDASAGLPRQLTLMQRRPAARPTLVLALPERTEVGWTALQRIGQAVGEDADYALLEPRGSGEQNVQPSHDSALLRAGVAVGLTPMMLWVEDVLRMLPLLRAHAGPAVRQVYLYGQGDGAVAALLALALLEGAGVAGAIFAGLPTRLEDAWQQVIGLQQTATLPQLLGSLAPLPVALVRPGAGGLGFDVLWASRAYDRVRPGALLRADHPLLALRQLQALAS